jgi:hypothetical protein
MDIFRWVPLARCDYVVSTVFVITQWFLPFGRL